MDVGHSFVFTNSKSCLWKYTKIASYYCKLCKYIWYSKIFIKKTVKLVINTNISSM